MELTHFNEQGRARMVDVSEKAQTFRVARAEATVRMAKTTMDKIKEGSIGKGDVLAVAQVAGIMAAKKNSELIPMCSRSFPSRCAMRASRTSTSASTR